MAGSFSPTEITLTELAGSPLKELSARALRFTDAAGLDWVAPQGTLTDGASVPRMALAISDGRFEAVFLKAAVVHDAFCQEDNAHLPVYRSRGWRETHRMFHEACLAGGTPPLRARVMFAAVWWFGPRWADPEGEAARPPEDAARAGMAATKAWIEDQDPSLDEIEAEIARRAGVATEIHALQMQAIGQIAAGDGQSALGPMLAADTRLAVELLTAPGDLMLANLQGYQHKNWAMLSAGEMHDRLMLAETQFRRVLAAEPRDASALNGLGSVAILRQDWDAAVWFIEDALKQDPGYAAARHDLANVQAYLAGRSSLE